MKGSSSVRYLFLLVYALALTLANEVQLFLGLGIYTGIFAIYLQCPSKESKTAIIVFYVLCLLYVLSMTDVAIDVLQNILDVSDNSICKIIIMQMRIGALSFQFKNDSQSVIFRLEIAQVIASGSCDFIAQCILVRINHCTYHWHPSRYWNPRTSEPLSLKVTLKPP